MKSMAVHSVVFSILILSSVADASSLLRSFHRSIVRKLNSESEPPQISPAPAQLVRESSSSGPSGAGDGRESPRISPAPGPSADECLSAWKTCNDSGTMTACIDPSPTVSKEVLLLVKNNGNNPLNVNVTSSHDKKEIQIPGHHAKKVIISANIGGQSSIKFNGGNGECIIHVGSPASSGGISNYLPFYATNITPISGAYLLFLTTLIIGVTWACCKLGKRDRQGDGIPYQELEMGQPDSLSANNVEVAEGWDQDWGDDEWDDTNSVKFPSGCEEYNPSANGVTSRDSNRNGWKKDRED